MGFVFSLATVLAVRYQREQAEERALADLNFQIQQTQTAVERIDADLAKTSEKRVRDVQQLLDGAHFHASYARLQLLQRGRGELLEHLQVLGQRRAQQQQAYFAALRAREMLSDLEGKQRVAYMVAATRREQKRSDDLFLARRLRG